jgi:hypothetical protein
MHSGKLSLESWQNPASDHHEEMEKKSDAGPGMPLVVGAIRSGTTLLRLMLDAHSCIAMAPETSFPKSLFLEAAHLPGESVGARVVRTPKWPDLGIDREEYLAGCARRSGVEALEFVWELYGIRHAKPIVGDKSPGYVRFLPEIERVLPRIRVIHLIRDGRDCYASQLHSRFSLYSPVIRTAEAQAAEWCEAVGAGRRDGPRLAAYLEVRFEELIIETKRVLTEICSFLGVPFEPKMLEYHQRADARLQELRNRKIEGGQRQSAEVRREAFALARLPPDETRVGRWRETLLPGAVADYERVAGMMLGECGYSLGVVMLARNDDQAAQENAIASHTALTRLGYVEAKRLSTLAYRCTPASVQRMRELEALAEWTQDLAIQWRMQLACQDLSETRFGDSLPAWNGEPADAAKRLFVWKFFRHLGAEVRYAAALSNLDGMAKYCSVEVDSRLVPLLARRFPEIDFIPRGADLDKTVPPGTAFHATWERMGYFLLPSASSMPKEPWLRADEQRVRQFARRRFPRTLFPRVALVWHSTNANKSLPPPAAWRHLLAVRGIEFVSAQHDADPHGIAEWCNLGRRIRIERMDLYNDLDGLAAVLKSCDLLIAISATQAHLAGALGVPTWLVVREEPLLSWPLGHAETVWYPSLRCVWVKDNSLWDATFASLAKDLRALRNRWLFRHVSAQFKK